MFSSVSEVLSFHPQFFAKNAKITFFEEKRVLRVVFIELKGRWLQTGPAYLKKNTKHLYFFLRVDFLRIFENITFFRFLKIVSSTW